MMKSLLTTIILFAVCNVSNGQDQFFDPLNGFGIGKSAADPLVISAELVPIDRRTVELRVTATLADGHYIYSMDPSFGAATKIQVTNGGEFEASTGGFKPDHPPKVVDDPSLERTVEKFFEQVTWSQEFVLKSGSLSPDATISGEVEGMYCTVGQGDDGGLCFPLIPAREFTAAITGKIPADTGQSPDSVQSRAGQSSGTQVVSGLVPSGKGKSPIQYTISLSPDSPSVGADVTLSVRADISEGWHTYSISQDSSGGGPIATTIELETIDGLQQVDAKFVASSEPEIDRSLEDIGIVSEAHHRTVTWTKRFTATKESIRVAGKVNYQICDENSCQPPDSVLFALAVGTTGNRGLPSGAREAVDSTTAEITVPLDDSLNAPPDLTADGLVPFLLGAIGLGLASLLTPCVFPMIPVTVGFFLKQEENKDGSTLKLATIYCLSIVAGFTLFGVVLSAVLGPAAVVDLANNPWLNLFFAAVFFAFGLMLMGVFELRIPSWILTWSSKKESSGGVIGVMFMAMTFVLVSFTCTFAFVATLVAVAAKGDYLWPIIGMLAYSTAFASPFFLLALFPGMLKKLPKSGGWMNTIKVTFGLVELALMVKFLSVADIGFSESNTPYFLDYTTAMMAWVALSFVTGLYLLGLFRIGHDTPVSSISAVRCLFATAFLGLGLFLTAGVYAASTPNGWLWEQIVGFAPPRVGSGGGMVQSTNSNSQAVPGSALPNIELNAASQETKPVAKALAEKISLSHHGLRYSLDYAHAVEVARKYDRPIFVDFTGVNCANCRQMEQTVLSSSTVHSALEDFVRVQLFLDLMPGPVSADVKTTLLTTNRDLSLKLMGGLGMPNYVILSPDGQSVMSRFGSKKRDVQNFVEFLNAGLNRWKQSLVSEVALK